MGAYFTALDRQFPKKSEKIQINSGRALRTLSQAEKVFHLSETTPLGFSRGHVTHSGRDLGFFPDSEDVFGGDQVGVCNRGNLSHRGDQRWIGLGKFEEQVPGHRGLQTVSLPRLVSQGQG